MKCPCGVTLKPHPAKGHYSCPGCKLHWTYAELKKVKS